MSSIVIAGDTSGSVTLQAPATAGSTVLTLPSTTGTIVTASGTATAGGVAYGNGTTAAYSAAGTSGQLLQSNGVSAPSWVTASASALTLLSTVTASNSATVDVESTFSSTYDAYMIVMSGVTLQTDATRLWVRLKIGGSYISTGTYVYHNHDAPSGSGTYSSDISSTDTNFFISKATGNAAEKSINGWMYLFSPASTAFAKQALWLTNSMTNTGANSWLEGGGHNTGTGALTGVRFLSSSGNIAAGKFRLYGISNS